MQARRSRILTPAIFLPFLYFLWKEDKAARINGVLTTTLGLFFGGVDRGGNFVLAQNPPRSDAAVVRAFSDLGLGPSPTQRLPRIPFQRTRQKSGSRLVPEIPGWKSTEERVGHCGYVGQRDLVIP